MSRSASPAPRGPQAGEPGAAALRLRRLMRVLGLVGFLCALGFLGAALLLTEVGTTARWVCLAGVAVGALLVVAYLVTSGREVADFFTSRQFVYGGNVALVVVVSAAIVVFVNLIGAKFYAAADWTGAASFTLSSETQNLVRSLPGDLKVMTFFPDGEDLSRLRDLLERYKRLSRHLQVQYVNVYDEAEVKPLMTTYNLTLGEVVVVLDYQGKKKVLERYEIFTSEGPAYPYMREMPREIFKGEDAITAAIRTLVEEEPPVIMFTTGFGEPGLDSYREPNAFGAIAEEMRRSNMKCQSLPMFARSEIPDTCDVLVVAAPEKSYGATEVKAIKTFLQDREGKAVFLLEPVLEERGGRAYVALTGLEDLLKDLGVEVGRTLVVEGPDRRIFERPLFFGAGGDSYQRHAIIDALEGVTTVWSSVRSLKDTGEHTGLQVAPLVQTSSQAWAETDLRDFDDGRIQFDEGVDIKGPISIAIAVSAASPYPMPGQEEPEGMRLVVFADGSFAGNGMMGGGYANRDLFINTLRWLTRRTASMGIEAKEVDKTFFTVSGHQRTFVWISALGMAVLAVAAGLVVWIVRR